MTSRSYHDYHCVVTKIDRRHGRRTVAMKVLALGMCRTGTDSLRAALKILGYDEVYHGYTAGIDNPRDCKMWLEACAAKFEGKGTVYGKAEFDQLLGHCQAVTDFPCIAFSEELIKAYPDAKVVLTLRDVNAWHSSMMRTFHPWLSDPLLPYLSFLNKLFLMETRFVLPLYQKLFHHFFRGSLDKNGREVFEEYYSTLRTLVPSDRLLEYSVAEGWEPLCQFLSCKQPMAEFPKGNGVESFKGRIEAATRQSILDGLQKVLFLAVTIFVLLTVARHAVENKSSLYRWIRS